jgi:hypothetical protein
LFIQNNITLPYNFKYQKINKLKFQNNIIVPIKVVDLKKYINFSPQWISCVTRIRIRTQIRSTRVFTCWLWCGWTPQVWAYMSSHTRLFVKTNRKKKEISFVTLRIFSRALQIYQNILICYVGCGYTPKILYHNCFL